MSVVRLMVAIRVDFLLDFQLLIVYHPNRLILNILRKGEGWRLRHVSLEGPESAVFYRGRLTGSNTIELPYYWKDLVHEDSITVSIQPIGSTQKIIVMEFDNEKIILSGNTDCFFHVYGERKDVNPLLTEYEGKDRYDYPDPNFNENSELSVEGRNYTDPNYEFPRNTITT